MHYRRRLRSRIIVSFLLLGFGLTAAFALATLALRSRLEGQLLDNTLRDEANSLNVQVRTDPDRAVAAFEAIAATGRDALRQLRRTLGVLRSDGPQRQPQPGLEAVAQLHRHHRVQPQLPERSAEIQFGSREPEHVRGRGAVRRWRARVAHRPDHRCTIRHGV